MERIKKNDNHALYLDVKCLDRTLNKADEGSETDELECMTYYLCPAGEVASGITDISSVLEIYKENTYKEGLYAIYVDYTAKTVKVITRVTNTDGDEDFERMISSAMKSLEGRVAHLCFVDYTITYAYYTKPNSIFWDEVEKLRADISAEADK